ncbi:MAG: LexA family transcriptional regulator [Crocinitomicaceae bacterium]|nr:LexA family transcriptional regulator [Crocinitomicaceae bacterium]
MSLLADNMRYLRTQLDKSQQAIADDLIITRGRYSKYEDGASEPPLDILLRISRYFHISIDLLISIDLRKYPLKEIMALPDNRIVLPIKVDSRGENKIEIIPHKASMGYLAGYSDPEYLESLDTISLPFLAKGKYRAFPAEGDSMPPHKDGSYIIGRYHEGLNGLKPGKSYVFITRSEGITYKRLSGIESDMIIVSADNPFYKPYSIPFSDIFEIWEYASSIATQEVSKDDFNPDSQKILAMLGELQTGINAQKS